MGALRRELGCLERRIDEGTKLQEQRLESLQVAHIRFENEAKEHHNTLMEFVLKDKELAEAKGVCLLERLKHLEGALGQRAAAGAKSCALSLAERGMPPRHVLG